MEIKFKEHEIERAIEVYLQLQFNGKVAVNGIDLSGMRSRDGLAIAVDFTLVGESDIREPKVNNNASSYVDTTEITSSNLPNLSETDLEDWKSYLELITNNVGDKNASAIIELVSRVSDNVLERINQDDMYKDLIERNSSTNEVTQNNENETPDVTTEEVNNHNDSIQKEEVKEKKLFTTNSAEPKNILGTPLGTMPNNVNDTSQFTSTSRPLFPNR